MTPDQLETEARAKVFWGEPPAEVISFLRHNGMTPDAASNCVGQFMKERSASIRHDAVRAVVVGAAMVAVPAITYLVLVRLEVFPLKLFGITIALGVFGCWKLSKGILNLAVPSSEKGDLAKPSD